MASVHYSGQNSADVLTHPFTPASGVGVKVMQELLRYANSRITLDIYSHAGR